MYSRITASSRPTVVTKQLTQYREFDASPEFHFLAAVAIALDDKPDIETARAYLDSAEAASGAGQVLPLAGMRALLASRSVQPPNVPDDLLVAEIAQHREAAQHNIVDLYFMGWGEVVAEKLLGQPVDPLPTRPELRNVANTVRISDFGRRVGQLTSPP